MKKIFSIIALVAVAVPAVVSCSVSSMPEETAGSVGVSSVFASIEVPEDGTRAYANENRYVCWNESDSISVFDHFSFNRKYVYDGIPGEASGNFNLVPEGTFITGNELPYMYAVYPYSIDHSILLAFEKPAFDLTTSNVQKYEYRSFDKSANLMLSVSDGKDIKFRNLGGYLVLKLYGAGISVQKISLVSNGGEELYGRMYIDMEPGGLPETHSFFGFGSQLWLNCPEPVKLGSSPEEATEFWFVTTPLTMESGFSTEVFLTNGTSVSIQKSGSVSISRNKITRMAPIEIVPPPFDWDSVEGTWTAQDYDDGQKEGSAYTVTIQKVDEENLTLTNLWGGGETITGTIGFDRETRSASISFPAQQTVYDATSYGYGPMVIIGKNDAGEWDESSAAKATVDGSGMTIGPWNLLITQGKYTGYVYGASYTTVLTKN